MITLSKTRPADGKPNPYRTRWCEIEGVTIEVVSTSLNGPWMVSLDLDLLHRLDTGRHRKPESFGQQTLTWIEGPHYWCAVALTLADARAEIDALVASPEWPATRDAYLALLAEARR